MINCDSLIVWLIYDIFWRFYFRHTMQFSSFETYFIQSFMEMVRKKWKKATWDEMHTDFKMAHYALLLEVGHFVFYYHTIWNCWKAKSKRKWPISQRKINQPFSNRSVYFVTWPIFVIAILGHSKSPWIKFWSGSCIRVQT